MKQIKPAACTGKGIYRAFLAASLIALMPATISPAAAQDEEKPRWFGSSFDNRTTVLAYGIPDSDYVALSFSCRPGAAIVKIGVQDEESSAEEGAIVPVRMASGGIHMEFSEKARSNQDSGGIELHSDLPLTETLRRLLTSGDALEITVDGHKQRYGMEGAAEPAAAMIAACDAPKPASDLDVTVTNKAKRPLESFAYSQAGVNSFDADTFGYEPLAAGASREFTIPGGRDICTFDISVLFVADDDEECCSDPLPAGTQNLCENSAFVVHD
ncbi:MAG: hypothetical protein L0I29_07950 [Hyphomicrobiales bacterium]|nr:hypothetical protein [Hyphomicrobiales bacterium]